MWIGRICLFGWLSAYVSRFIMEPKSHRNYVAFLEKKLLQASRFLPLGKYTLRKFMKRILNSTLREK
tara:strand:+ start:1202 stop:1402 length:201 start_codon:yes stop_codon:yes gene_type:complete